MNDALDTATVRALAVEAEVDPRTFRRFLRRLPVKGLCERRIRRVLGNHGLLALMGGGNR